MIYSHRLKRQTSLREPETTSLLLCTCIGWRRARKCSVGPLGQREAAQPNCGLAGHAGTAARALAS